MKTIILEADGRPEASFFAQISENAVNSYPDLQKSLKEVRAMYVLEYKDGEKPEKLIPKAKANMERCANFLAGMIEKYGKEVLDEIEAEEREEVEKQQQGSSVKNL